MRNSFGSLLKHPVGLAVLINLVWWGVAWIAGIQFNYVVNFFILTVDLIIAWVALDRLTYFFSQFILPIQNAKQRHEIYERVKNLESGQRGPSLFIENGDLIETHLEEEEQTTRKGPGVIVVDTSSAAMLRTQTEYRDTIGPGVTFTKSNEFLESYVDLRSQMKYVGPKGDGEDTEAYTRDEVKIKATFIVKFNICRPKTKMPTKSGIISEYGYEEAAVRRAIVEQNVKTSEDDEEDFITIYWDEVPGGIVSSLWHEYVSKFRLTELFSPSKENNNESGLRFIERMMNARVSQPFVQSVDSEGNLLDNKEESIEYHVLKSHGLEIKEIQIDAVDLDKADEEKLLDPWKPEWMKDIEKEEKSLNEADAWNATLAREETSKRFAQILMSDFDPQAAGKNPFSTLLTLIKPLKEFLLVRSADSSEIDVRLRKLTDVWKWLVDHEAEFTRSRGKG